MSETAIVFSAGGAQSVGVLALPEPATTRPELGFVLVHGGARGRLGNTFAYPFIARALARAGYPSLRFDPPGLGEAADEIGTCDVREVYERVVSGHFVESTLAAVHEFRGRLRPKRVVLLGICGGASTAQLAAAHCPSVEGLVLVSSPVLVQSTRGPRLSETSGYAARQLRESYATRVLSPEAWWRALTLQSDWGAILKHGRAALFGEGSPADRLGRAVAGRFRAVARGGVGAAAPTASSRVYPGFVASLDAFVGRGGEALFLFGSNDYFKTQFDQEFRARHWDANPRYERSCEVHVVPDANHMFTLREWQREAVRKTLEWSARRLVSPARGDAATPAE